MPMMKEKHSQAPQVGILHPSFYFARALAAAGNGRHWTTFRTATKQMFVRTMLLQCGEVCSEVALWDRRSKAYYGSRSKNGFVPPGREAELRKTELSTAIGQWNLCGQPSRSCFLSYGCMNVITL